MDPLFLIIRTLGQIIAFIAVLRFLMQTMNVDYYNPISQAVARITQPLVAPLQRVLPRIGRVDISALIVAFLFTLLTLFILVSLSQIEVDVVTLTVLSLVSVFNLLLTILFWATIGSVIISWVAPGSHHPGPQLIVQLTEPLFAQVRRVLPALGGLDLSPILIFLVIRLIQSQLPVTPM